MRIAIKEIHLNEDLYPREQYSNQLAYMYSQAMESGAKFPPIKVGVLNGRYVLIDGKHRIEAEKIRGNDEIESEVIEGLSSEDIFEYAVRDNISHGKSLSPYERRKIALKLRQWNYGDEHISELIQVPMDKLENFVGQRLVNSLTGETIVKSQIKHFGGEVVSDKELEEIKNNQKKMFSSNQGVLLSNVLKLLKKGYYDMNDERTVSRLKSLRRILNSISLPGDKQ